MFQDMTVDNRADRNQRYRQKDACNTGHLFTSKHGKDAVKLENLKFRIPCFVVEIETIIEEADEFKRLILPSS